MTTLIPKNKITSTTSINRTISEKLDDFVNAADFGVVADGSTDNTTNLQNALNYAAVNGICLILPPGIINISDAISVDLSTSTTTNYMSVVGQGISSTNIVYTGSTDIAVLTFNGNGAAAYPKINGFKISRAITSPPLSTALTLQRFTNSDILDVQIYGFKTGVSIINCNGLKFEGLDCLYNETSFSAPAPSSGLISYPNALNFISCRFNNASGNTSVYLNNGVTNNFTSCVFEANGTSVADTAVSINYNGSNGAASSTFTSCYFEVNFGHDIYITTSAGGTHSFIGNTFNRISNVNYTVNSLVIDASILSSGSPDNVVYMAGNGFATLGSYVPSSSRKSVVLAAGSTGYVGFEVVDYNWYQSTLEVPVYANNWTGITKSTGFQGQTYFVNTIDSDADIGGTSGAGFQYSLRQAYGIRASTPVSHVWNSYNGSSLHDFRYKGASCGAISVATNTTTYATSSDYRLKENVAPIFSALDTVNKLNPVTYTWKNTEIASQGFIAHELQAIIPEAVTGTKDAVDSEGNPVYQGIDTSFLVATLTSAIKELSTKVTSLEEQVISLGIK